MQPFTILEGISKGKITLDIILASQDEKPEDFEKTERELMEAYDGSF